MSGDDLIYPRQLLSSSRVRFPKFVDLIDEAEMNVPAMESLADHWHDETRTEIPFDGTPPSAAALCRLFSVVAVYRGVELAEGLARELEADALYPAGSIARSLLELVGLTSLARRR